MLFDKVIKLDVLILATLKVYHDFFSYRGGVYRHTDLSAQDRTGYHSVRIIGWGQEQDYRGRVQKYWVILLLLLYLVLNLI